MISTRAAGDPCAARAEKLSVQATYKYHEPILIAASLPSCRQIYTSKTATKTIAGEGSTWLDLSSRGFLSKRDLLVDTINRARTEPQDLTLTCDICQQNTRHHKAVFAQGLIQRAAPIRAIEAICRAPPPGRTYWVLGWLGERKWTC